ncbi:hypothetical protein GCM10027614_52370 [Micromonospora vulcania]
MQLGPGQSGGQQSGRLGAGPTPGDKLRQHRVVVHPDHRAGQHARVEPQAGPGKGTELGGHPGDREPVQGAGGRPPARRGILGAEAYLDRVPAAGRQLRRQRLALGDAQLQPDQVQPGAQLGHRVLHLEPGVHLEEEELPARGEQELHRAGTQVVDRPPGGHCRLVQRRTHLLGHDRRRLFDDLLMAALDRALPVAERDHPAVGVAEDLHLDVPAALDVPLDEDRAVAERGGRLAARRSDGLGEPGVVPDDPHPAAAATGGRLDQHGKVGDLVGCGPARQHRHTRVGQQRLGRELVAHRGDHLGRRPDPGQPRVGHRRGELGVLGQEPVARVDGVRAAAAGRVQDQIDPQVRLGGRVTRQPDRLVGLGDERRVDVGVRMHGDRLHTECAAGREDPAGDLPRLATRSRVIMFAQPLHPEDAEAVGALHRSVVDRRQAEPEDGAGVPGSITPSS